MDRPGQTMYVCVMWRQARMGKMAAIDRTVTAVAQVYLSDVRSRQRVGVLVVECARVETCCCGGSVGSSRECGESGATKTTNCAAGSRINFNRRDPLARFATSVFA